MRQEESLDGAVEDHDLDLRIGLERGDHRVQLRQRIGPEDVHGWKVEGDPPQGGRTPLEMNPLALLLGGHLRLLQHGSGRIFLG